jgi:pimeloyl-ACP methyl ester carboxylesterase
MRTITADKLCVPGAELHYEVRGRGPALLMIPGGPADSSIFGPLADQLMDRYTVITYDPRGISRSSFEGGPADLRIEVHADDAARLIAAVDEGPAYVFGSSGGAIYGLDLTAYYPAHVRALVAHEPLLTALLPDDAHWCQPDHDVRDDDVTYGLHTAMELFSETTALGVPKNGEPRPMRDPIDGNMDVFFRVLVPMMCRYTPAIDVLCIGRPRVIVGGGDASCDRLPYRAASALARRLGTALTHFPGDHGGFMADPEAFADRLHEVLVESDR